MENDSEELTTGGVSMLDIDRENELLRELVVNPETTI